MAILQDFTADQDALKAVIHRIRASGATGLYNALYITLRQFGGHAEGRTLQRRAIVLVAADRREDAVAGQLPCPSQDRLLRAGPD